MSMRELSDEALDAHSSAYQAEWDRWGMRDNRWGGKGFEVFRYDDSDISGNFSEIHSFDVEVDAQNALDAMRRRSSSRAAIVALDGTL